MLAKVVKKLALLGVSLALVSTAYAQTITGAGASFPYPIYAKWASLYEKESGTKVNYQSIGSGGGQQQIIAKTVNFGASDDPMKAEQLEQHQLLQFPAIIGGTVPVVNLPEFKAGELKLSGSLLADIFLGKIKPLVLITLDRQTASKPFGFANTLPIRVYRPLRRCRIYASRHDNLALPQSFHD